MGEREQSITNIRQVILSRIKEILSEEYRREFDGDELGVNFDLRCNEVVVEQLVGDKGQTKGYLVDLQGLPDPDRFSKTFGLDLENRENDHFVGTIMLLGDYQRLASLVSQLK